MFHLFHRNCLYNESIEPHCAYCSHCKPENEYQGVCEYRGIVAMAGSCRRFEYDALRRKPPKPARIRGRFSADDFYFTEQEPDEKTIENQPVKEDLPPSKPLIPDDLSQFSDLWEDDDDISSEPENNKEENDIPEEENEKTSKEEENEV